MHEEIFRIAKFYGDSCQNCKEVCCANMLLTIHRAEIKRMAKHLDMDPEEFKKMHTMLFSQYAKSKGDNFKTCSKYGEQQFNLNPRILLFKEEGVMESCITDEQKQRLFDLIPNDKKEKLRILMCPFYDKETHKCKVHNARPGACYEYPFNPDDGMLDLRKVNACELSTNFLRRLNNFAKEKGMFSPIIENTLMSGEYYNHFPIPMVVALTYIVHECRQHNLPINKDIEEAYEMLNKDPMVKSMIPI